MRRLTTHQSTSHEPPAVPEAVAPSPTIATFEEMFDAHVDAVYHFVHRRCRDHPLSEDITQETFLAAMRTTSDPGSITVGWLITVARNRLVDVLRRQTRYEEKLRLIGAAAPQDCGIDLADRLRVEKALAELSVNHRLVITLHYIDGLSVPEMAEHLGRSVKSIEALVTRARQELRSKLNGSAETMERDRS